MILGLKYNKNDLVSIFSIPGDNFYHRSSSQN